MELNKKLYFCSKSFVMSIEVKNISKFYGSQKALDEISFSIKKGEIVGLLGPNGAGKSTLMKILTSYLVADEGIASVNNFDVIQDKYLVQKIVGYLPEHNPLYLDMYVREYLAFNTSVYNIKSSRIQEVINLTGLTLECSKKIGQLSKGYRQRVGIATALLHNPEVLILDEPTTGLDPNQLVEIRDMIKNIGKDKTVILSTHIMQEVEAICDRVIIINKGKIVTDKKLDNLMTEEQEQVIEVEFDKVISSDLLNILPNLKSAEKKTELTWELRFISSEDMRSAIFDFANEYQFKILQLNLKSKKLEDIFIEKTKKKN